MPDFQTTRALLVEHRAADTRLIREMLTDDEVEHVDLVAVDALSKAFDLLSVDSFDVVLFELKLPDSDGLEGLNRLRAAAPQTPVVVLSEPGDEPLAMAAVDQGAQEFVFRNGDAGDQLRSAIRQAIARTEADERLTRLALHDPLTGLPNRALLDERLQRACYRGQRERRPFAILFLDLDGFKHVNDTLGHTIGDQLLKQVARRLETITRKVDTVARPGGDEFVLLAEGLKCPEDAGVVAEKAERVLGQPFTIEGHSMMIGASIGISLYPRDSLNSEELVKFADHAMYAAKRAGRHRYCYYDQSLGGPEDTPSRPDDSPSEPLVAHAS